MSEKKSFKRLIIFTIAATMCLVTISFLPTASAADIYVPGDYSSIQDAIDNANPGDTIYVAAGTYHENLASWKDMEITKSLNLIGAGSGSTIVEFRQVQNGMEIRGTDLTILIEGFTFTKIPGNTYASNFNFKIAETTSSFINLTLRDVEVAYAQGPNVNLGSNGIFDKVFIENCNFHHAGTWGLYSQGNVLDMEVTDSHFDNNGLVDASHGIGFDLSSSSGHSNIHVSGGTFNDNTMKGINIVKTNNAIFEDVEANNNGDHGVCLWEWVDTSQNLIFNNPSLIGNGLDGFLIGAQTGTTVSSVSIDQGILQGNGRAGLFIYNMGGTIQNIGINNANIIGNTNWGVYTNTATVVDAECNWWDSTSGPTHASNGYNIGLQGQPVSNNVDWCPYLDDSYPSGICWGPVQNTRTLEYFCTIQSGIDDTDTIDGDTLTVAPGTYIETAASYCDINLNKDVSLIGAGSGSTIIELTQGKSEGLQITGTNPSDITIEGMTFTYQSGSTNAAKRALRVFSDLNSLTLRDVVVEYAEVNNVELDGDITTLTIEDCNFHHAGVNGLMCPADISSGSITGSNFDYNGRLDVWASGIHLFGLTSNLDIIDCSMSYNTDSGFNGRQLDNIYFEDITASYNTHSGGGGGICISEKVSSSSDITMIDITAEHNGRDGILIWTWYDYCSISDVTITGGLFTNNGWGGIRVLNWPASGSTGGTITNVNITEAQIENNPNAGVWFELGYGSSDATSSRVNYNNIQGNTNYGILNSGSGLLCGKCNWWGDGSGPSGVSSGIGDPVSDNVIYCPWLTDEYPYGDCIGGAICWNQQTGEYFCSIQAAIDDPDTNDQTGDHDTIEVFAVTDIEQVNVYKSVTIYGQGIGNTIIQSPDVLTDYFTTSNNNYPIVYINNIDEVIIHNLTIDGAGKGNANYRFVGIGIYQAGATVSNVEVIGVRDTPFSGAQHGVGIYGWSDGTGIGYNVVIEDCSVYDYQKTGIALGGSDLTVDINNCEVTGVGPTTVTAQNGIQVSHSATGSITENEVSSCSYTGASWAASGILPYLAGGVLEISNNIIYENQANIYLGACSADITGNTVTASSSGTGQTYFYGIIGDPGDPPIIPDASPIDDGTPPVDKTTYVITCEDNVVTGDGSSGGVGIGVYAGMYGTYDIEFTAMHNNVLNWGYGFELYEYDPNNLIFANINYNNIVGNDYGIYNWLSKDYDCTCNWYGDITGPTHASNPLGVGDPVSDYVIFMPWLNLPFEDPDSVCEVGLCQDIVYIDDDFTSSTPGWYIDHFSTIQVALDRLETDGTAIIYDGEYDEQVFIDDDFCDNTGITIKGAYESFPLDETAILLGNITISVSDVTIKYLEFNPSPDDPAILVEDNVAGTTLAFNKFFREECESDTIIGVQALGTSIVNAAFNWWSVPDGPYGGLLNNGQTANGLGVNIIGEVLVEPWLGIHSAAQVSPIHVEVGEPVMFDADDSFGYSSDGNPLTLSYLWDFDDESWSMEEQTGYSYDEPGIYHGYLRVSGNDITLWSRTMYDWAYFTIIVTEPGAPLTAHADGNDLGTYEGTIEEPVTFYGLASGGTPGYTYEWSIDEYQLEGQTVRYTFTESGSYTVELTVTDSEFNTATDTATVTIAGIDELIAHAGGPYNGIISETIRLTGQASGGKKPYTFTWDFGDDSSPVTAQNPLHIYQTEGTYTVTLTVTDANGMIDESTATVTINDNHGIPEIVDVKGGFGVKATIITSDLPVDWTIILNGEYVFGRTTSTGVIAPNEEETIKAPFVFGFGKVDITIKANDAVSEHTAFMLGPLVLSLK